MLLSLIHAAVLPLLGFITPNVVCDSYCGPPPNLHEIIEELLNIAIVLPY